jgi:energy-coupling factor transporter ATP-binding protein EcfA2
MAFDFKKLKAQKNEVKPFLALILGASGSGKSTLIGTLGKKTLYLYTSGENHGPTAASVFNKNNIYPVLLDKDEEGNSLKPDDSIKKLFDILKDPELPKNFEAVVVDSFSEIEFILLSSNLCKAFCTNDKGVYSKWNETAFTSTKLRDIVLCFEELQKKGVDTFATCPAEVKEAEDGSSAVVSPRLMGFSVADNVLLKFPDIMITARLAQEDEDGESVVGHKVLFDAGVLKVSKDKGGNVVKARNFGPRLTGISFNDLPPMAPADLKAIHKFRVKMLKGGTDE